MGCLRLNRQPSLFSPLGLPLGQACLSSPALLPFLLLPSSCWAMSHSCSAQILPPALPPLCKRWSDARPAAAPVYLFSAAAMSWRPAICVYSGSAQQRGAAVVKRCMPSTAARSAASSSALEAKDNIILDVCRELVDARNSVTP